MDMSSINDLIADQAWGLEIGGDPVMTVETVNGGVNITQHDSGDEMLFDRDELAWLIETLQKAQAFLVSKQPVTE